MRLSVFLPQSNIRYISANESLMLFNPVDKNFNEPLA